MYAVKTLVVRPGQETRNNKSHCRNGTNWGSNGPRLCGPAAALVPEGKFFWVISGYKETPNGMGARGSLFVLLECIGKSFLFSRVDCFGATHSGYKVFHHLLSGVGLGQKYL